MVSGSVSTGGSVAFSTAFASHTPAGTVNTSVSGTVAGRSLTQAQIPSHRHFVSANITGNALGNLTASNSMRRGGHQELTTNNAEDYHLGGAGTTDATVGRTSATGSGQSHDHGWSGSASSQFFRQRNRPFGQLCRRYRRPEGLICKLRSSQIAR